MATTDTVRGWFHETVSNHSQRGTPGYEPRCNWGIADIAPFPAEGGGTYREPVHPATAEAWDAYIAVMEHFGETIPSAGGVNSCRNIGSSDWPSLHAYLVAVDHPPNSRMRQDFIDAVLAIRTNNGKQVFLNGVVFNDRMHNQLNCSQADLKTGIDWNTVKGARDDMVTRGTKADEGNDDLRPSFDRLVELGIMSEHTQPGGVAFNDEFATFLVRAKVDKIDEILQRLRALEQGSGGDGLQRGDTVTLT